MFDKKKKRVIIKASRIFSILEVVLLDVLMSECPMCIMIHGYYLGQELRTWQDGKVTYRVTIAVSSGAYVISVSEGDAANVFSKVPQFSEVLLSARPYCSKNGALFWADGKLLATGSGR